MGIALLKLAVEGLHLCGPELEMAHIGLLVTAERNLGWAVRKHVKDLAVYTESVRAFDMGTRVGNVLVTSHIWWLLKTVSPPL